MTRLIREHRVFISIWIALTIAVLVPVWSQRLLPMLDTPNHLGLVRGWHSYHDPSYHIADYYNLRIRIVPYILFYWAIHMLMYVVSIETANKLFLSAYLILFPLAILYLATALRRSHWLALGAFALAFNMNWIYGFSSYLMGTAMMFFALAALISHLRHGSQRSLFVLFVACELTYLSHIMPWVIFGLCAVMLLLRHYRRWRRGIWASLAMVPSVILAVGAVFQDESEKGYMKSAGFEGVFHDVPTALMEFPKRVMELFPGNLDYRVLGVITVTVIGLAIWRGIHVKDDDAVESGDLMSLVILLFVLYISLPYEIRRPMSWWNISPRMPSAMAPLLLLLPAVRLEGRQPLLVLPMIIACIVLPLHLSTLYRDFSRRNEPMMHLIERVPRGKNTLLIMRGMIWGDPPAESSGDPAVSAPCYWHFPSWPAALNGGYNGYLFDQGIPIVPKRNIALPAVPHWGAGDSFELQWAPDWDYYLIRNSTSDFDDDPALAIVARDAEWTLYKKVKPIRTGAQ